MSLLTPLLWIAIMLPFFIIAMIKTNNTQIKYLLYFLLYFLIDCCIQALSKDFLSFKSQGLNFAWVGKILSLLLSLIIIFSVDKDSRKAIGFSLKTNSKKQIKFGILFFLGFLIFDFIFKMIFFRKGGNLTVKLFYFRQRCLVLQKK
ncbi:hypothetical protein [Chryseobacterium sp.]|uniref:hypothetical protein n=1 Tax=Chryseobacterium sp. TaxID=1871047 RepID=UPI00289E657C|nr:hypothetical protein [Chryseobacterium sp.]